MRGHKHRQDNPNHKPWHKITERDDLQNEAVERKQHRANQRLLLQVASGNPKRMAGLAEKRNEFSLVHRAAQRRFPLFNLRAEIVAQLRNDVILLLTRQPESNSL